MKLVTFLFCLAVAAVMAYSAARADDANTLPPDQPTTVNGVNVACTGIGDDANTDPRWPEYAVRIEFANANAEYLADIDITVSDASGEQILALRCDSPWFLADLPPGKYTVSGTFKGTLTKTAKFTAPRTGQARIIVRYPEVAGD
jgi:hypothetical protein